MCFTKTNNHLFDSLNRPLELNRMDESLWSDKCNYLDPENFNLIVLQLNIRSLLSHQNNLRQLLQIMANKNSTADIVLLCETFLTSRTEKIVNIPGYNIVTMNRTQHKGGGVAILIRDGIPYKQKHNLDCMKEKELECIHRHYR